MAKKRFKIRDKQGNPVDYDISAASVTIDVEGKSLEVKLSELVDAISRSVKSVTFNGNSPTMDSNGNVNLGQQVQPDWNEGNINWPSFIRNKPSFSRVATTGSYNDLTDKPTIPEGVATDSQMSDSSDAPVKNRVIKAYVDNIISGLVNGAPQALDTLKELSAALGNDANFAATITNQLANKANSADVYTKSQTYDKDEVDNAIDEKLTEVTVNAVGNSATMYFAGSALCIASANLIQVTATPTITYVDNEQNVVVSVSGNGTLKAYLDGVEQTLVNGSFTIAKTSVAQSVVVTATAKEDGKAISTVASETIAVAAYVDLTYHLTGYSTNQSSFPIFLNAASSASYNAVVDTTKTKDFNGTTCYYFDFDLTNESSTTELKNASRKNIFGVSSSNSTDPGIYEIEHVPDNITTLTSTFLNCSSLKGIGLNNVTTLADRVFGECAGFTGVLDLSASKTTTVNSQSFFNCKNITGIKFPSTLTSLGTLSLSNIKNGTVFVLQTLEFTSSTPPSFGGTSAGNSCISDCTALSEIRVPQGTESAYATAMNTVLGYLGKTATYTAGSGVITLTNS